MRIKCSMLKYPNLHLYLGDDRSSEICRAYYAKNFWLQIAAVTWAGRGHEHALVLGPGLRVGDGVGWRPGLSNRSSSFGQGLGLLLVPKNYERMTR